MTLRIVQCTAGSVGRKSVHAIAANSDLEPVGDHKLKGHLCRRTHTASSNG